LCSGNDVQQAVEPGLKLQAEFLHDALSGYFIQHSKDPGETVHSFGVGGGMGVIQDLSLGYFVQHSTDPGLVSHSFLGAHDASLGYLVQHSVDPGKLTHSFGVGSGMGVIHDLSLGNSVQHAVDPGFVSHIVGMIHDGWSGYAPQHESLPGSVSQIARDLPQSVPSMPPSGTVNDAHVSARVGHVLVPTRSGRNTPGA